MPTTPRPGDESPEREATGSTTHRSPSSLPTRRSLRAPADAAAAQADSAATAVAPSGAAVEASAAEPAPRRSGRRAGAPERLPEVPERLPEAGERADAADATGVTAVEPLKVAASLVAVPRPHAPRAGRRAASASTDELDKPSGGRRAAVPSGDAPTARETTPGTRSVEVVLPAVDPPAAPAPAGSVKAVSRRSLRGSAPADTPATSGAPAHAPTGRRGARGSIAKGTFSVVAMLFAAGIAVATTLPAEAFSAASDVAGGEVVADVAPDAQELTTAADVTSSTIARDGYGVTDPRELQAALRASGMRLANTFTNNPLGTIQWPFPVGVPISDGYGPRESPGGIGSTDHKGVDFTPGQGTTIQSIADGVVSKVVPYDGGGLGVYVMVDHVINGQNVTSVYGHMLTGSIEVSEGQIVKVAQALGKVGNTGTSTGAHLHLEIRLDGVTPVDPYAWLQANAN